MSIRLKALSNGTGSDMDSETTELLPATGFPLPEGYDEWLFKRAVQDLIAKCGGNRKVAEGIAIDLVKEETEMQP